MATYLNCIDNSHATLGTSLSFSYSGWDFDEVNSRLFLLHEFIPDGQFGLQYLVSVYQVSGGE